MTKIKVHENCVDQLKSLKGYEFPSLQYDENAQLKSEDIKRVSDMLRKTMVYGSYPIMQGKYGERTNQNPLGYPPIDIPPTDFYQTVHPRELQFILEHAVSRTPEPHLYLLYLEVKAANEKTKFG